jgi:hypothetical protein
MKPIEAKYQALMAAVDSDLESGNAERALARLEEFIRNHELPDDLLLDLIGQSWCESAWNVRSP